MTKDQGQGLVCSAIPRLSLAALLILLLPLSLCAQSARFSSGAEYQSMLAELHHEPTRPSRLGTGTLLETAAPPTNLKVSDSAGSLNLETEAWRIEIGKDRWGLVWENKQTGLTWRIRNATWAATAGGSQPISIGRVTRVEGRGNDWQFEAALDGSSGTATFEVRAVSPTVVLLSLPAPQGEREGRLKLDFQGEGPFFGLGERFARANLDGLDVTLRPEDLLGDRPAGHHWTYIPVPFLFTPRGLGLYLDTSAVSRFDLRRAADRRFTTEVDDPAVDCYLFAGAPKSILRDYTALTGRTPLSPPWAFGVWICSYQGPGAVLADARRLRQYGIPSSAIWVFDVMGKGRSMGWPLWWTGYYPNPRNLTDELHRLGFKVLTYCYPFVRQMLNPYLLPNPSYEEGVRKGLFVLNAAGEPTGPGFEPYIDANLDFANPKAVDWWEDMLRDIVVNDNFDGWMEDFGEWVHDTDRFSGGRTGREMTNLYPLLYHRITYEISRAAKRDVVEFVRSGYAGSQGYTRVVWGGDQFLDWTGDYGLPSVVPAGITAGLSGFAVWGPDINGNGHSKELWMRWVEFGALTPVMRTHLWDKPPGAVDIWHDAQTIKTFRRYARLHISLFPYFYTYAREAANTGLPIIRHPFFEFPDDPNTYEEEAAYFLGDRILVAPVIEKGATARTLYLPRGSWCDYWTGQVLAGGRKVTVAAPLERIPVLVRAGSVLPLISPDTETLAQSPAGSASDDSLTRSLTWRVFPSSASAPSSGSDGFTLYDGTRATANQGPTETMLRVEASPMVRRYEVILPATRAPGRVVLDGKTLTPLSRAGNRSQKARGVQGAGWRFDPGLRRLEVQFSGRDFKLEVAK